MNEIPPSLAKRNGAETGAIHGAERDLGVKFPLDFVQFLTLSNGAEGPIGAGDYLALWSAEEMAPLNRDAAVEQFAPGIVLFGSDGADTGYGFDYRRNPPTVIEVPLVGMALEQVCFLMPTFEEFLIAKARLTS